MPLADIVGMLLFKDLPVSWIGPAQSFGFVPDSGVIYVAAKIACIFIELVTSCLLWLNMAMVTSTLFVGTEVIKAYLEDIG